LRSTAKGRGSTDSCDKASVRTSSQRAFFRPPPPHPSWAAEPKKCGLFTRCTADELIRHCFRLLGWSSWRAWPGAPFTRVSHKLLSVWRRSAPRPNAESARSGAREAWMPNSPTNGRCSKAPAGVVRRVRTRTCQKVSSPIGLCCCLPRSPAAYAGEAATFALGSWERRPYRL
jgi:hypothetical protein